MAQQEITTDYRLTMESSTDYQAGGDIETGAGERGNDPLKMVAESTALEKVAAVIAAAAVGTAVAAMVMTLGNSIVVVAGILSCIIGPYAYYQQTQLTDIKTLQETQEALKEEVDRLTVENDRLGASVKDLTQTVDKLEDTEQALDILTKTQGQSVSTFADQVKENRDILRKMQGNLRANVLQNIISVLIRSDTDGDFIIDDAEIDDLCGRLQRMNGVTVHEDKIRKVIQDNNGDINALMKICQDVMTKKHEDEEMFTIEDDDEAE